MCVSPIDQATDQLTDLWAHLGRFQRQQISEFRHCGAFPTYKNPQINELSKFKNFISLLHCLQVAMIKSRCLNINFETWVYVFPWAVSVTLGPMRAQGAQAQSSSWLIPIHTGINLFQHTATNLFQSAYSDTLGPAFS